MWIRCVNAVDFGELAFAERLCGIDAPDAFEQTLPPQDFVQAGDAAGEVVGSVEERCVRVRHFDVSPQHLRWDLIGCDELVTTFQKLNRALRPDRPMPQESSDDPPID